MDNNISTYTEELIKKIGLGTVQFGLDYGISNYKGKTSFNEVKAILDYAKKNNIITLDTASQYGDSEQLLGKIGVINYNVITKCINVSTKQELSSQLYTSLDKLNLSKIYGYLFHRAEDVLKEPNLWQEMSLFKKKQIVSKIGFSFNSIDEIEKILNMGISPSIIQVPYNYLDNRFEKYMIDLHSQGCEIHTRSVFLQGLFFVNPLSLPSFFDEIKETLKSLCNQRHLSSSLIKYCLSKKFIDKVIIGVNNLTQLMENIDNLENAILLDNCNLTINNSILTPSKWPKRI
ncbi:MAG: aldo/keto reductase [Candidatus Muirbacterium halophilum]|nr:aldo/keto reductase [Candidatus Muirbacterium halophilum]